MIRKVVRIALVDLLDGEDEDELLRQRKAAVIDLAATPFKLAENDIFQYPPGTAENLKAIAAARAWSTQ